MALILLQKLQVCAGVHACAVRVCGCGCARVCAGARVQGVCAWARRVKVRVCARVRLCMGVRVRVRLCMGVRASVCGRAE